MLQAGPALSSAAPVSLLPKYFPAPSPAPSAPPPAPHASAAPPPVANTSASSAPDLSGLVSQDPAYTQALADEKAATDAAGASRDAAINQALISFGAVPDFASLGKSLGLTDAQINAITGGIGPNTASLANQYTSSGDSALAQLNQAHTQTLENLRASLAGRGALESGATGVGVGQENQHYQQGLSDAYQKLLQNLTGFEDTYLNASNGARTALENAASSAYDRAVQMAEKYPGLDSGNPSQVAYNLGATEAGGTPLSTGALSRAGIGVGGAASTVPDSYYGGGGLAGGLGLGTAPKPRKAPLINPYTTGQKRFG